MSLMKKVKQALTGESGASNVEIIVWISVVLVISIALFAFRTQIIGFLTRAGRSVDQLRVN